MLETLLLPKAPLLNRVQDIDSMLMTKLSSGNSTRHGGAAPPKDLTGNLPADQLHQMFPTPPSHEHPNIASPAEMMADADLSYGGAGIQVTVIFIPISNSSRTGISRNFLNVFTDLLASVKCGSKAHNST